LILCYSVLALVERRVKRPHKPIWFGVGIAHGYATLGSIGYEGRFQYSATGKVANLASRLCDQAKNGQILIDINVFCAVETLADVEFAGELVLKGFSRPVKHSTCVTSAAQNRKSESDRLESSIPRAGVRKKRAQAMAGDKAKPAKVLELFAQFFDGHDSEHIPAAHAAGRFERRSRAPYDLLCR
jgi:hypothetical protein